MLREVSTAGGDGALDGATVLPRSPQRAATAMSQPGRGGLRRARSSGAVGLQSLHQARFAEAQSHALLDQRLDEYLVEYRRSQKREDASVKVQTVWRGHYANAKMLRVMARRRGVLRPMLVSWHGVAVAQRHNKELAKRKVSERPAPLACPSPVPIASLSTFAHPLLLATSSRLFAHPLAFFTHARFHCRRCSVGRTTTRRPRSRYACWRSCCRRPSDPRPPRPTGASSSRSGGTSYCASPHIIARHRASPRVTARHRASPSSQSDRRVRRIRTRWTRYTLD